MIRQELLDEGFSIDAVFCRSHYFNAVARGEDQPLVDALTMNQVGNRLRQAGLRDMHPLADLDRSRAMIDANKGQIHRSSNRKPATSTAGAMIDANMSQVHWG
jgi:hypothetical protein